MSVLKQLMNNQENLQNLIEIARNFNDLEFEEKLYKLRICYIRQAIVIFNLQEIENELNIINRGLIILNQNKNNYIITNIINVHYQIKLLEEKKNIVIKKKVLDEKLTTCRTDLANYLTTDVLYKLQHIRKNLLDIIINIKGI